MKYILSFILIGCVSQVFCVDPGMPCTASDSNLGICTRSSHCKIMNSPNDPSGCSSDLFGVEMHCCIASTLPDLGESCTPGTSVRGICVDSGTCPSGLQTSFSCFNGICCQVPPRIAEVCEDNVGTQGVCTKSEHCSDNTAVSGVCEGEGVVCCTLFPGTENDKCSLTNGKEGACSMSDAIGCSSATKTPTCSGGLDCCSKFAFPGAACSLKNGDPGVCTKSAYCTQDPLLQYQAECQDFVPNVCCPLPNLPAVGEDCVAGFLMEGTCSGQSDCGAVTSSDGCLNSASNKCCANKAELGQACEADDGTSGKCTKSQHCLDMATVGNCATGGFCCTSLPSTDGTTCTFNALLDGTCSSLRCNNGGKNSCGGGKSCCIGRGVGVNCKTKTGFLGTCVNKKHCRVSGDSVIQGVCFDSRTVCCPNTDLPAFFSKCSYDISREGVCEINSCTFGSTSMETCAPASQCCKNEPEIGETCDASSGESGVCTLSAHCKNQTATADNCQGSDSVCCPTNNLPSNFADRCSHINGTAGKCVSVSNCVNAVGSCKDRDCCPLEVGDFCKLVSGGLGTCVESSSCGNPTFKGACQGDDIVCCESDQLPGSGLTCNYQGNPEVVNGTCSNNGCDQNIFSSNTCSDNLKCCLPRSAFGEACNGEARGGFCTRRSGCKSYTADVGSCQDDLVCCPSLPDAIGDICNGPGNKTGFCRPPGACSSEIYSTCFNLDCCIPDENQVPVGESCSTDGSVALCIHYSHCKAAPPGVVLQANCVGEGIVCCPQLHLPAADDDCTIDQNNNGICTKIRSSNCLDFAKSSTCQTPETYACCKKLASTIGENCINTGKIGVCKNSADCASINMSSGNCTSSEVCCLPPSVPGLEERCTFADGVDGVCVPTVDCNSEKINGSLCANGLSCCKLEKQACGIDKYCVFHSNCHSMNKTRGVCKMGDACCPMNGLPMEGQECGVERSNEGACVLKSDCKGNIITNNTVCESGTYCCDEPFGIGVPCCNGGTWQKNCSENFIGPDCDNCDIKGLKCCIENMNEPCYYNVGRQLYRGICTRNDECETKALFPLDVSEADDSVLRDCVSSSLRCCDDD